MPNPQKAKGNRWERAVRDHLKATLDPNAYRPRAEGVDDIGDIHAAGATLQAKDWKSWETAMRVGLDGAVRQAEASGHRPGIAVVKRARRPVGDAYAVLRLDDLTDLLREARRVRPEHVGR